ncbi:MAG TPA: PAS domain S-box protein, partial [Polyangiaceae bacterium]|nr:PAS domain S-box protein [Polyangiaceae bacterium]
MSVSAKVSVGPSLAEERLLRPVLALLAPFLALVLELLLWDVIHPHVWFLFYPATFISAAIGGRRLGLVATATSTVLVWSFILRPSSIQTIDPGDLFAALVFFATGVAFAFFHERLTKALTAAGAKTQLEAHLREVTRVQERLQRLDSEHRVFAALIENSPDFIGITDASGKPTYVNPAGRKMVGLPADRPVEDTEIADYYPPEQRAFATDVIVKSMLEKGHWQGETYLRNWQSGEVIPVSDLMFTIRDPETDQLLGTATITREISDLDRVREELQHTNVKLAEARAFLENVLESSTEYSIIAKNLQRRILSWNQGAQRNYGYQTSEVIGRLSDMLHVEDEVRSGAVAKLYEQALAEGHATGLLRRRRKDGSEFLARVMVTRRNDANGNAIGYLAISHDVTAEQRHVEEQQFLADVGEALQSSLDYAATGHRIAELAVGFLGDGCALDVVVDDLNLRRLKVVHTDPDKAGLAAALEDILPGRNHPLWHVLQTKQPLLYPEVHPDVLRAAARDDAHLRLLEAVGVESAMLVPLVARDRLVAVLTIVSCSSGHRYSDDDLRVGSELARRASLALENAHLYEVAQEAIRVRDQVLGVVAHDLRNPLSTILMAAQRLRPRNGEPERRTRRPVDSIERAATRMNRLIRDLLDVTRMEAGHLSVEGARLAPAQIVRDAIEEQREVVASASIELRTELDEVAPDI